MRSTVLVAGATGMLGSRIAHHLLDELQADVRLLVRPGRATAVDALVAGGATAVEADLTDPASLDRATDGVDVVVSAVQGGPDVIIDGQVALAEAAKRSGARRILPSDFALDLFKSPPGLHPGFDLRREADEAIRAVGLEHVHVLNGAFTDLFLGSGPAVAIDLDAGTAEFWSTGEERFEATSIEDTARYTARAALDPALPSGKFAVAGERLSFGEVVAVHERLTGRTLRRVSRGSVDELRAWIEERRAAEDHMAVMLGMYQRYMLTGETALEDLQNERYPDVVPVRLADLAPQRAAA